MIIKSGNDYFGNLVIENYPNLQSIIVKQKSLMNLNSLKICNCEKLKSIKIEIANFCREIICPCNYPLDLLIIRQGMKTVEKVP